MEWILELLRENADEKYRVFNERLTPGTEGCSLGVRTPALRKIALRILAGDAAAFLDSSLGSDLHEINLLHAIVLAKCNLTFEERLDRLRAFVPTIGNWAVCDVLCGDLKPAAECLEEMLAFLLPYLKSKKEFEQRFGYVMLMMYFHSDAFIDRTLALYADFSHEGYYARMGAAWGLSILFVHQREKVLAFLKSDSLDRFTHNKAIQKCIESLQVSAEDKQLLRSLKRKE